jgi:hypothetical protein
LLRDLLHLLRREGLCAAQLQHGHPEADGDRRVRCARLDARAARQARLGWPELETVGARALATELEEAALVGRGAVARSGRIALREIVESNLVGAQRLRRHGFDDLAADGLGCAALREREQADAYDERLGQSTVCHDWNHRHSSDQRC